MFDSCLLRQHKDLYEQCLEQLLPIASERVQAVERDWWDLDSFLGLAFHMLLSEADPQLRTQVVQLLPKFGAEAVPTLLMIVEQQTLDDELRTLADSTLSKINTDELVIGLIDTLNATEDDIFDAPVAKRLAEMGTVATDAIASLFADPEWQGLALRIMTQFQQMQHQQLANLEEVFENSPALKHPDPENNIGQTAESLLKAAAKAETFSYRQAIALYTEAIQIYPDDARAYGGRGLLRSNLGDKQGAIVDFSHAAQLFQKQGKTANFEIALGYLNSMASRVPNLA
ncbi:hypothetical protein HRE53_29210 (plasmid) [Acaryochloris sp. 'Moss Beach']|uniref:hypothetical protein n=1 Tax=Acaryochloris sp. 'Moss Beach' TaxID=2740837 RepID=UPI001F382A51|nr:hypothetical protein [Acaryochloris sp. 'Moss Beach']UJB72843.1 hypothetical protein HRE53_29210 [Acaryochloris sp. 'Moss Beach']